MFRPADPTKPTVCECSVFSAADPERVREWTERIEEQVRFPDTRRSVRVFGKSHVEPRDVAGFSADGATAYKYSGSSVPGQDMPEVVREILEAVNGYTGQNFNYVLVNRYRDGRDCIGEHHDDETDLDPNAPIVSMSFGAERTFRLKPGTSRKALMRQQGMPEEALRRHDIALKPGTLLVIPPRINRAFVHSVPRTTRVKTARVSLTFRRVLKK